jgi:hypothetical protein
MAVAVTKTPIVSFNTLTTVTKNAATADTDALAEAFTITPTKKFGKCVLTIGTIPGGTPDGNITVSIPAGVQWQGEAFSATFTKGIAERDIQLETAKYLSAAGTIVVTLTPASTDKLLTDHAAYVVFRQLL